MSSNFVSLNPSNTDFLIFGLPQQLSKFNNPTVDLGLYNFPDLRHIRNTIDQTTACTIAASLIRSKIDY